MPVQKSQKELIPKESTMGSDYPMKIEFNESDEKIISATLKAFESGTLTPLIKEELRCTIQSRRIAEGKDEMKVEFRTPARKKKMSDDEMKRAQKRRHQNREAAQRFRQKQKDVMDYLGAKIRRLEKSSKSLTEDLKRLRDEKGYLTQMLSDHLLICTSSPQNTVWPTIGVEQMLGPTVSPTLSSVSEPESSTSGLETATSDGSVFFSFDPSVTNSGLVPIDNDFRSNVIDSDDIPKNVCLEEIVVDVNGDALGYVTDYLSDSCSSVGTTSSMYGSSCSSEIASLSESAADLSQSIASAHTLVHMDSCSSESFYPSGLSEADFLLHNISP